MTPPKPNRTSQDYALWAALPMAYTSQVEGRLKTILDKSRCRRRLTRGAVAVALTLTVGLAVAVGTAQTPPRSLMAAITFGGYPDDTPAHRIAEVTYLTAQIKRFGDTDPWAGKAYYLLGNAEWAAGRFDDASASFARAIALPEPPNIPNDIRLSIHSSARYERVNVLHSAGRYAEAVAETQGLIGRQGRGLISPDFGEYLREGLPNLKSMRDIKANRDAEKGHFAALIADPNWTRTLANGVTVQFLGVMQSRGNWHTIWSPSGRFLSRAEYTSQGLNMAGYIGPNPNRKIILILRLQYPVGQAVITGYEVKNSISSGYQSGFARNGTSVITDEMAFGPETSGCRVVEAWFLAAQQNTTLRAGVALVPPPFGTNDPGNAPKDWVEFYNIALPPNQ